MPSVKTNNKEERKEKNKVVPLETLFQTQNICQSTLTVNVCSHCQCLRILPIFVFEKEILLPDYLSIYSDNV